MLRKLNVEYIKRNYEKYKDELANISNREINSLFSSLLSTYDGLINFGIVDEFPRNDDAATFFKNSPEAFKKIVKFAKYLDKNSKHIDFATNLQKLRIMCSDFNQMQLDKIIGDYDALFSDKDWDAANQYFSENPSEGYAGSANDLMYSYIRTEDGISRRTKGLGEGSYGRTKSGENKDVDRTSSAIKRQKVRPYASWRETYKQEKARELLDEALEYCYFASFNGETNNPKYNYLINLIRLVEDNLESHAEQVLEELLWLPRVEKEAEFNLDLGVATSNIVIRRNEDGEIYKVYQEMRDIGISLLDYLNTHTISDQERTDLSVKLLLLTRDLHAGKISLSGKQYAHLDIKYENILIDSKGDLHFIDFGLSKDEDLDEQHTSTSGSERFRPISFDPNDVIDARRRFSERIIDETPSYFFDDEIAARRTIYHQLYQNGIINYDFYQLMPDYITALIDTHSIPDCIAKQSQHTPEYISAVLITYQYDGRRCTRDFVNDLVNDSEQQQEIIAEYQAAKQKLVGLDTEGIKEKVYNGELDLKYLPDGYRLNADIKPEFLEFLLDNDLLSVQELYIVAENLFAILLDTQIERSFLSSILNNDVFLDIYLQNVNQDEFESTINLIILSQKPTPNSIYTREIFAQNDWDNLCMSCLLHNRQSTKLIEKADMGSVFIRMVSLALFPNELKSTFVLKGLCSQLTDAKPTFELSLDEAKTALERVNNKLPGLDTENADSELLNLLQNLDTIRAEVIAILAEAPDDFTSAKYQNAKSFFAFYVSLQTNAQELIHRHVSAKDFKRSLIELSSEYAKTIKANYPIKQAFKNIQVLGNNEAKATSITTNKYGLFNTEYVGDTDEESLDESLEDNIDSPNRLN